MLLRKWIGTKGGGPFLLSATTPSLRVPQKLILHLLGEKAILNWCLNIFLAKSIPLVIVRWMIEQVIFKLEAPASNQFTFTQILRAVIHTCFHDVIYP